MLNTFIYERAILSRVFLTHLGRQRLFIPDLLVGVGGVVGRAHLAVGAKRQRPINDPNPVVRLWIIRLQLDVLHVVSLRLLEFGGREGCSSHLVKDRADAVNRREILGVAAQDILELRNRLLPFAHVFF